MRWMGLVTTALCAIGMGCGGSGPVAPASTEPPEQIAARVFDKAQSLEKSGQSRQAFAAYRQIAEQFPSSPQGKKAAEHIRQAQKKALRSAAAPKKR